MLELYLIDLLYLYHWMMLHNVEVSIAKMGPERLWLSII